jgi:serine phosphatase RsbU (regulator of sigma subunit)
MNKSKIHIILPLILSVLLISPQVKVKGQFGIRSSNPDSIRMVELYDQARALFAQNMNLEALSSAEDGLKLAMRIDQVSYEISLLEIIGDIFSSTGQHANSIPYYLRRANLLEIKEDTARLPKAYEKIALAYQHEKVFEKELEYHTKSYDMLDKDNGVKLLQVKELMALAAFRDRQMDVAKKHFIDLTEKYPGKGNDWLRSKQYLIKVFDANSAYDSALICCEELLWVYEERSDVEQIFRLQNNIGYYQTLLGDFEGASGSYINAIESGIAASADPRDVALMMTNAGVSFQNMEERNDAIDYFNQAIQILNENEHYAEESRVENMLATIYLQKGDLYNAGQFSLGAIEAAEKVNDPVRKSEAYLTYSQILRKGNDPINALEHYEKYLIIRDSISMEDKIAEREMEDKKFQLEKEERDLQLRLKEEEVSDLAIRQLMLQKDRIEQEKELLMNEKDLQLLEQQRLQQDMVITQQNYEAERQDRENRALEQEKLFAEQQSELDAQKLRDTERENQLLEKQQRLDQLELERQAATKKAFIGISAGGLLIAVIILSLLISTRRKKKLLAATKIEIEDKNVDLEQKNEEISTQMDEIEAQRNLVFEQKEAIELYSDEVMKSIEYAKRIQASILPERAAMKENVADSFVLFRPRDVVSGDFFWYAKVEEKLVFAVADSTGHGVPGAFMSMMGTSLLKEVVQKEYITHPGVILRRMRKEIINNMGQKGISGEQRDGYDMAIICIDYEEKKLDYAGAYNSLYLIRSKDHPAPDLDELEEKDPVSKDGFVLYEIAADKMPIAHYDRMDKFTNKEISVFEGDQFYMFTDGYADQFGGPKGKKFMYKPFKQLLLSNAKHPMETQHKVLNETISEWMGISPQIDDICVMGVKI